MKITKIEKKKRLYLLELDNSEKLYITEDTIVHFMLSKEKEITQEELTEIPEYAQCSYGKNLALYFISFKQRTEQEVKNYLYKHEIDDKIIPTIIENLKSDNWINDASYTENFIQQNSYNGDKGPFILKQKLLQKGITKSIIDECLEKENFYDIALRAAQKLLKKYQGKFPSKAIRDKISQNLLNKGFSYQNTQEIIQELDIDKEENEIELIYHDLDKIFPKYQKKYDGYQLKQHLIQNLARKGYDFSDINSVLRDYL